MGEQSEDGLQARVNELLARYFWEHELTNGPPEDFPGERDRFQIIQELFEVLNPPLERAQKKGAEEPERSAFGISTLEELDEIVSASVHPDADAKEFLSSLQPRTHVIAATLGLAECSLAPIQAASRDFSLELRTRETASACLWNAGSTCASPAAGGARPGN